MVPRIVLARPPCVELGLRGLVQCGRQCDDPADVEGRVRPAVEPLSNARHDRVVDGRMTERARDPHRRELAGVVHHALHADDGIQPQERQRHCGIIQALSRLDGRDHLRRQRVSIDLEADRKRRGRVHRGNDFVHPQYVGPKLLVAEGVEAEDLLPRLDTDGVVGRLEGRVHLSGGEDDRRQRTQKDDGCGADESRRAPPEGLECRARKRFPRIGAG